MDTPLGIKPKSIKLAIVASPSSTGLNGNAEGRGFHWLDRSESLRELLGEKGISRRDGGVMMLTWIEDGNSFVVKQWQG